MVVFIPPIPESSTGQQASHCHFCDVFGMGIMAEKHVPGGPPTKNTAFKSLYHIDCIVDDEMPMPLCS